MKDMSGDGIVGFVLGDFLGKIVALYIVEKCGGGLLCTFQTRDVKPHPQPLDLHSVVPF